MHACLAESNSLKLVSKTKNHYEVTPFKVHSNSILEFFIDEKLGGTAFQEFSGLYESTITEFIDSYSMTRTEAIRVISTFLQIKVHNSDYAPV